EFRRVLFRSGLPVLRAGDVHVGHDALVRELVDGEAVGEARFGVRALRADRGRRGRVRVPSLLDEVAERLIVLEEEHDAVRLAAAAEPHTRQPPPPATPPPPPPDTRNATLKLSKTA